MRLSDTSFNRNIVECKFASHLPGSRPAAGFNRNIVECKYHLVNDCRRHFSVLIETLWNVNRQNRFRSLVGILF